MCDAQTQTFTCGRRWGKSEAMAIRSVLKGLLLPRYRFGIFSPTISQSDVMFEMAKQFLMRAPEIHDLWRIKESYPKEIRYLHPDNEGVTRTRTLGDGMSGANKGRSARGEEYDEIVVDEAAYTDESAINEVVRPMLLTTGGKLTMISTPNGLNHFYRYYLLGLNSGENAVSVTYPSSANPYNSADFLAQEKRMIPERSYLQEYEARFCSSDGAVFKKVTDNYLHSLALPIKGGVMGVDLARSFDYCAMISANQDGALTHIDRWNNTTWKDSIDKIVFWAEQLLVSTLLIDATGVGDPIYEMLLPALRGKCNIIPVKFTAENKRIIIDTLAVSIEQGKVRYPEHQGLVDELLSYQMTVSSSGNIKFGAPSGRHDDYVIALALVAWGLRESQIFTWNIHES